MAKITSSVAGTTATYVITDVSGNTATVTAPATGANWIMAGITVATVGNLLRDGMLMLDNLLQLLYTGLRPNVIPGTNSFQS